MTRYRRSSTEGKTLDRNLCLFYNDVDGDRSRVGFDLPVNSYLPKLSRMALAREAV